MRNSPWYLVALLVFIGSFMGYAYAGSEVHSVYVTGKHLEDARGRRGSTSTRYVIDTDKGALPILKFPIIGYSLGVEEVYAGISPGDRLEVRLGIWPPAVLGNSGRTHIMTVY